jgi:predicted kinase
VEKRRKTVNFAAIYAMDETAVWFDDPGNRCIETRGAKEVRNSAVHLPIFPMIAL